MEILRAAFVMGVFCCCYCGGLGVSQVIEDVCEVVVLDCVVGLECF